MANEYLSQEDYEKIKREGIQPKSKKEWIKENNEKLKEANLVIKDRRIEWAKWLSIIFLIFIIVFGIIAYNDKFKSDIKFNPVTNITLYCEKQVCPEMISNLNFTCNPKLYCNIPDLIKINITT